MACCPAHEDKNPSLSVKENSNGDVLINCFAGCNSTDVLSAIGLEMKDLYNMPLPTNGNGSTRFKSDSERQAFFSSNSLTQACRGGVKIPTGGRNFERPAPSLKILGRKMSEIEEEPITWLWEPFIPLGMYTLIDGEEGIGKTWVTLAVAAAVSTGRGLPGVRSDQHISAGNVLLFAPEDSAAQVVKPRLRQMGADMERIVIVEDVISLNTVEGILEYKLTLQAHNPRLVIFDPIFACVGGIDLNQDNQVRTITSKLKSLSEEFNHAVCGVRHIGKAKGMGEARNAGLGGVGWRASARSNLLIGKNPEDARDRAIVQIKTNLLPETPQALGYTITGDGLLWAGKSPLTATQMLSFRQQETHQERSEREEAAEFLRETLREDPVESNTIKKLASAAGISEATLRRAKAQIGVKAVKLGAGQWAWKL